jgi:hypothetical protein
MANPPPPPPITIVEFPPGLADQFFFYKWDQQDEDPIDLPARISLIVNGAHDEILKEAKAVAPPNPAYPYRHIANVDIGLKLVYGQYQDPPDLQYFWATWTISVAPVATVVWSDKKSKIDPINLPVRRIPTP